MKNHKAVVLLSAGLDSTVNLFLAHKELTVTHAITFNYGQKAALKEIEHSKKITQKLGIEHVVLDLLWLKKISSSSLTQEQEKIPTGQKVSIDDMQISKVTAQSVWVPNRNGVFLNMAASFAESFQAKYVIPGFNLEEAQTFPDNSEAYMQACDTAFSFSTHNQVQVKCYTVKMNKTEIVGIAIKEQVPLSLMWPCYFAHEKWCGECESCQRFSRALKENQIEFKGILK